MAKYSNNKFYKLLYSSIAVIALFIIQVFAGKAGGAVADLLSYCFTLVQKL